MKRAENFMSTNLITVDRRATLERAVKILFENKVGCVLILDEKQNCIGILTERDVLRFFAEKVSSSRLVEEVMTKNPITISPETTLVEVRSTMLGNKVRHLPVADKTGRTVGIISIRDVYNAMAVEF